MILTEEEAKTKWCPFVRHGEGAHNKWTTDLDPIGIVGCTCIASQCMAWRDAFNSFPEKLSDGSVILHPRGFCGLAGRLE